MSRVDDDRQAQRLAERLAQEKRLGEQRTQKKLEGESAFAKRLQQGGQETANAQRQGLSQKQEAQGKDGSRLLADGQTRAQEADSAHEQRDAKGTRERAEVRRGATAFGSKLKQAQTGEGARTGQGRLSDAARDGVASQGRAQDQQGAGLGAASRRQDAQTTQKAHDERGEGAVQSSLTGQAGAAARRGGKGEVKADADGGGGGGSGGQGKDGGKEAALAGGFRFNPALMAPVPVAKPKEGGSSERLRALANEIAQKIVQSARVGTNAAGKAEFQIDLRSNVLAGLSIKVSGGNGKIRAVFQGSDREVLKLLRAEADTLKQALGGRGLTLEELRIEERA